MPTNIARSSTSSYLSPIASPASLHRFDEQFCASTSQQLTPEIRTRLDGLLTTVISEEAASSEESRAPAPDEEVTTPAQRSRTVRQSLKQDVGQMSLEHTLEEIAKLERIEQLGLPATLFVQAPTAVPPAHCR